MGKYVTAEDAVSVIKSNDRVFIQTAAATPQKLVLAMTARAPELRNVELVSLHTEGDASYAKDEYAENFVISAFFVGANIRKAVQCGRANYIPIFLSEIPRLFTRGIMPLDVALVHVSPPDKHGFCSLGVSVDSAQAAVHTAKCVIAQVNPNMPRTHGDGLIHVRNINYLVEVNDPLPEFPPHALTDIEKEIGKHVAGIVEDGACMQMGIGAIPDAVLALLGNHKNLGIHTEMFSDGIIPLVEKGVINGEEKRVHPGKILGSFIMGSRKLYDFVDDNPLVVMLGSDYVNDTAVMRRNNKMTAINSAIEVDITGQVCADSIGTKQYSGVGGQMDFIRGASLSNGGKPIIALPSQTRRGESRIVPTLKSGASVVTTRAHVHYIATEYGIRYLYGKNTRQRAELMIEIAHPDHREALSKEAHQRFGSNVFPCN